MLKAKSRLHHTQPKTISATSPAVSDPVSSATPHTVKSSLGNRPLTGHAKTARQTKLLHAYLKHSPLLIPSLASYGLIWYLVSRLYPQQLANLPITGSFAPVIVPFFIGTFFLTSYLLLNSRLALYVALALTCALFLRLQQVLF